MQAVYYRCCKIYTMIYFRILKIKGWLRRAVLFSIMEMHFDFDPIRCHHSKTNKQTPYDHSGVFYLNWPQSEPGTHWTLIFSSLEVAQQSLWVCF